KVITEENGEPKQIVCGAKNISVGQIVPVALPGSVVTNRKTGEALVIKTGKIRGVASGGMLCAANELGIEEESEGIYILPESTKIGLDLIEELNLKPKAVLNIESRSNRGDALCMLGIAREVSACLNSPLKKDVYKETISSEVFGKIGWLKSQIVSEEVCSKVGFVKLKNVQVKESPDWIKEHLSEAGISCINNIVDITNFVMLEIGQPMHAYDEAKVDSENAICVQWAGKEYEGQKFIGLDEKEYKLSSKNLLITNNQEVLSLAGVMGGMKSSINENTKDIILEAACFEPWCVRQTSRSVGTVSESSRRFERGTNVELVEIALSRAIALLVEHAGAEVEGHTFTSNKISKEVTIEFDLEFYERIVGHPIKAERAEEILNNLGFVVEKLSIETFKITIPIYRQS
ncbi:MAG TPA: phenylalanine--tRNA ligase subunit beta, partial [Vampirovibrionales bacterium]